MGKKSMKKKVETTPTPPAPPSSSERPLGAAKVEHEKAASPAIVKEVEELIQQLENLVKDKSKDTLAEQEKILQKLHQHYKLIALKNKVDSKREELLSIEVNELDRKTNESRVELEQLKENLANAEAKIQKLDTLSQTLNNNIKSIEGKAQEDIKNEKMQRLQMSSDFRDKIQEISAKLDNLGKKRESIMTENSRLKQILKSCLDEYDKDQQAEKLKSEQSENNNNNNNNPLEEALLSFQFTGNPEDITLALMHDPELNSLESLLTDENKSMAYEDSLSKYSISKEKEYFLKSQISHFMNIFDTFQLRLNESNNLFKLKQTKVDDLTKEIKKKEKTIQENQVHIQECLQSHHNMNESINSLEADREKYMKVITKQQSLIDKFQEDLQAIELLLQQRQQKSTEPGDDTK